MIEAIANERMLTESVPAMDLVQFVEGMRRGDEQSLQALYDATVGKLYALSKAILKNVEDAEDVVCITYAYAWANAARYDANRGSVLGWLLMLCRSRALDRLRQRQTTVLTSPIPEDLEAEGERPDDILDLMQQHSRVRTALSKLTPDRRRLISFAFLQGLSHGEIARVTGLALGTVKSRLRRALIQLREELEGT